MEGILDKVKGGITKGVAAVGASSKAMMDKAKINTAIDNFRSERNELAKMLGQKVYEKFKSTGRVVVDESIASFIREIDNRTEAINNQHELLKKVEEELRTVVGGGSASEEGEVACGNCGHVNHGGAKFCAGCGSPSEAPAPAEGESRCGNCGELATQGTKFCAGCGNPVSAPAKEVIERECRKCGEPYSPGTKFCSSCGSPLG